MYTRWLWNRRQTNRRTKTKSEVRPKRPGGPDPWGSESPTKRTESPKVRIRYQWTLLMTPIYNQGPAWLINKKTWRLWTFHGLTSNKNKERTQRYRRSLNFWKIQTPPPVDVNEFGIGVVYLWSQRKSLTVINGVLRRILESAERLILYQQILVPGPLIKKFLYWVHGDPTSGHFGIQKTADKLQRYANWSGWRKRRGTFLWEDAIRAVGIARVRPVLSVSLRIY